MRSDLYWVYILSSTTRMLYTGCTSDLLKRMYQHMHGLFPGFTKRYSVTRLVWYDFSPNVAAIVAREREIKGWSRGKKIRLIEASNRGWEDLAFDWFGA